MIRRKFPILVTLTAALAALTWGASPAYAGNDKKDNSDRLDRGKKAVAARKEAFKRAAALGMKPGVAGWKDTSGNLKSTRGSLSVGATRTPNVGVPPVAPIPPFANAGGIPHYFGPFANWAYSPLPTGNLASITITAGGTGYTSPTVTVDDVYIPLVSCTFPWTATGGIVDPIATIPAACGATVFAAPWVTITDAGPGTGATADAFIGAATPGGLLNGGLLKFQDPVGGVTLAVKEPAGQESYPNSDYYEIGLVEFTHTFHSSLPATRQRGYVQIATAKVPGAVPLTYLTGPDAGTAINYPGTATPMFAVAPPSFLGPVVVAGSNRAVRFKFYNLLPVGPPAANGTRPGDLFLPVDETVMGSGLGPGNVPGSKAGDKFTQNRAAVHLHGNNTVWISDGTPHQWITPANETTPYPQGVSVYNVPDMFPATVDSPTDGTITLYYTNAMTARLMFYHDHAYGITRLNVYAGEAAGYVVTDAVDADLASGTNLTGINNVSGTPLQVFPPDVFGLGIPLVIQDRTFVDPATIGAQDPTWNWGTGARDPLTGKITEYKAGDLWYPHVYLSAQNPSDLSGFNPFGRWHYGPWFTPPTPTCTAPSTPAGCIDVGPVPNEYFGMGAWEPPLRPGVPNPSMPGEAFMDTPMVNGVVYPYIDLEPRAYRFRILNAANDRFWNLQLYVAADKRTPTTAGGIGAKACDGVTVPPAEANANCTEVAMRLVTQADLNQTAATPSGLPIEANAGPKMWQIGTEGGWLAAPFEVPLQPVGWVTDPTLFNVGNVNQRSLFLGPAERADVIVDFTAYAGKTLILYNDAPAAVPAGVPTYDYFTGDGNLLDAGGAPMTQPGYGPNTRTIMQIRVGTTATPADVRPDATFANLQAIWKKGSPLNPAKRGVFEFAQEPILIPQERYNSAYNLSFPTDANQLFMIADTQKTFTPLAKDPVTGAISLAPNPVTLPLQMKAMHDEMGGVYDTQFGRMSGMLGLTNPNTLAAFLIPYNYSSPPTDLVRLSDDVSMAPIGSAPDGTQFWRLFHNGVDTHPIHVHLFNAQLINRIGQDNLIVDPEPSEFGWKDTFKVNPLEVTFLALRPVIPTQAQLPFEVQDSIRLIEPGLPEGASLPDPPPAGWFDPQGIGIAEVLNHYVNFGWEYVWHCHILAHEEMDMMHSLIGVAAPMAPTNFTGAWDLKANPTVNLSWTDNSTKEAGYRIERATNSTFTSGLTAFNVAPNTVTYADKTVAINNQYWYRLTAIGATVGDTWVYPGSVGFPTNSANTTPLLASTNPIQVGIPPSTAPAAPTNLTVAAQAGPQATLSFRDNANNETGFTIERCTISATVTCTLAADFAQIAIAPPRNNTGNTSYVDATVAFGNTYRYRVAAVNAGGTSAYAPVQPLPPLATGVAATFPAIPPEPTSFTVSAVKANGNNYTATLIWTVSGPNPTNFTIQRAENALFTTNLNTSTVAGGLTTINQTINKNTTYYYRIRANNNLGGSSAWKNALPYPIRTGP